MLLIFIIIFLFIVTMLVIFIVILLLLIASPFLTDCVHYHVSIVTKNKKKFFFNFILFILSKANLSIYRVF